MRPAGDLYAAGWSQSLHAFAINLHPTSSLDSAVKEHVPKRAPELQRTLKRTRPARPPESPPEPAPETPLPASPPPALTFAVAQFAPRESHVCAVILDPACSLRLHCFFSLPAVQATQGLVSPQLPPQIQPGGSSQQPQDLIVPFGGGSLRTDRGLLFHATGNVQIRSQRNFGPCQSISAGHLQPVRVSSPAQELSLSYRDSRVLGFFSPFLFPPAVVRRAKKAAIVFILFSLYFLSLLRTSSWAFPSVNCWLRSLFSLIITSDSDFFLLFQSR